MELKNVVFYGNCNGVTRDIQPLMSVGTTNRKTYHKKYMNKKRIQTGANQIKKCKLIFKLKGNTLQIMALNTRGIDVMSSCFPFDEI